MFTKCLYNLRRSFIKMAGLYLLLTLSVLSCKKIEENLALRFLMDAMTNGRWLVNIYTNEGVDETAEFEGYEFQFTDDNKVYAITLTSELKGTWSASIDDRTIQANFPVSNGPLTRLNEKFKITNNTPKLVEAKPVDESRNVYLKLVKKAN
ncbi:MAG: hypothetical protein KIT80_01290 [Chitinophagaceae bacterium]|nr:hypothetical protein [Chitinophagaceae bacterium]MCW5925520.1 hypothetical protein [Chitinophagaceae bacterium]